MNKKLWTLAGLVTILAVGSGTWIYQYLERRAADERARNRQAFLENTKSRTMKKIPETVNFACGADGQAANPGFCQCVREPLEAYGASEEYKAVLDALDRGDVTASNIVQDKAIDVLRECSKRHNVNTAG